MNINERVTRWLLSDDVGLSSESICRHMMLGKQKNADYPKDPSDIGRCFRLLAAIPEWESRIGEMATYGAAWISLSERWQEIKQCMNEEVGIDWSKGSRAPNTYELMKIIQADGYRRDKNYKCTFGKDGYLQTASMI